MEKISFVEWEYEPEGQRKDKWRKAILKTLIAQKGYEITFHDSSYDLDKVMAMFCKGFRAETAVLEHLQSMNQNCNWRFVSEDAGYFVLDKAPDNKPDLTNDKKETVEVKGYKIYGDRVYFVSYLNDPARFWKEVIHGASALIVYDENLKKAGIIRDYQFWSHYTCEINNKNPNKTTWILTLTDIKQI